VASSLTQEVGVALGKGHIIVAENVVTRGGRMQQTIDIVRPRGGVVTAVGVIVGRSGANKPVFGCPFVSLIRLDMSTFEANNLLQDLFSIPAVKPGSS
jgi:orotate phosphoribosyltransferase